MAVLGFVPAEERSAVPPSVLDGPEALRKTGLILQGLEVRFGERVVVGGVQPRERLGDPQIRQQQGDGLAGHRGAAISVGRELARRDALPTAGLLDELRGQAALSCVANSHPVTYRLKMSSST